MNITIVDIGEMVTRVSSTSAHTRYNLGPESLSLTPNLLDGQPAAREG